MVTYFLNNHTCAIKEIAEAAIHGWRRYQPRYKGRHGSGYSTCYHSITGQSGPGDSKGDWYDGGSNEYAHEQVQPSQTQLQQSQRQYIEWMSSFFIALPV